MVVVFSFCTSICWSFFEGVHKENRLLGAVFDDLKVKAFVAGCRALGLISKLVTAPVWRILENKEVHVLDMSKHYQHLVNCFEKWAADASGVLKGEAVVFEGQRIENDEIFSHLIEPNPEFDVLTLQALELIFAALVVKTKRLLADHLEGGKYETPSQELQKETLSVAKTNIMPERDFGMLDRLMMEKPRATTLVLEGIVMFNKNQTGAWRDKLTTEKKALIMKMARQSKDRQRALYAKRQLDIRKKRMDKMAKQAEEEEKKAQKMRAKKQLLMDKIEEIGLWKTEKDVRDHLSKLQDENDKIVKLSLQIQFRKVVLGAVHQDKEVFQMSAKGKKFDSERLYGNLCSILKKAREDLDELLEEDQPQANQPLSISSEALKHQKEVYKKQAVEEQQKAQNKRRQGGPENVEGGGKKRRVVSENESSKLPVIHVPEDLVGKRVKQLCRMDDGSDDDKNDDDSGDIDAEWYNGVVVSVTGRGKNPWFEVRYDGYEGTWRYKLMKQFEDGVLELLPLEKEHLVGAPILHRLKVRHSEEWFKGKVLAIVPESDPQNPEFSVEYEDDEDSDEDSENEDSDGENEGSHIEEYPLIEDYLNGDLRLL